jgi:hypothetical protein
MGEVYELFDLKKREVLGHFKTLKQAQSAAELYLKTLE